MNHSRFSTPSQKAALFISAALRRDGHEATLLSRLVKGSTTFGMKDYHIHTVQSDVTTEIMRNYFEVCSDNFPVTFATSRGVIEEVIEPTRDNSLPFQL